jgi:hypothetical protein
MPANQPSLSQPERQQQTLHINVNYLEIRYK